MNPNWNRVTVLRQTEFGNIVKFSIGISYLVAGKKEVRETVGSMNPGHVFSLLAYRSIMGKAVVALAIQDYRTTEQTAA